jgi:hypothetical protein
MEGRHQLYAGADLDVIADAHRGRRLRIVGQVGLSGQRPGLV